MLYAAVISTTVAVALGSGLALWHLRATEGSSRPPHWVGLLHGGAGLAGLGFLLAALRGPARGVATGSASFGETAAWLFAAAVLTGIAVLVTRRRGPAITMAIHSGLAITGFVLLVAWYSLG